MLLYRSQAYCAQRRPAVEKKAACRDNSPCRVWRKYIFGGGALGFDTLAAQEVIRVRAENAFEIRLILVLPCLGQESRWTERDAAVYRALLRQADEVIYTGDIYTRGCMFQRNRYMVDHSATCLCYLTDAARGGTVYTVNYAREHGLKVINLAQAYLPEEIEEEQLSFL